MGAIVFTACAPPDSDAETELVAREAAAPTVTTDSVSAPPGAAQAPTAQAPTAQAPTAQAPTTRAAPTDDDHAAAFEKRASQFWQAKTEEDWSTLYLFQDPEIIAGITEDEFFEWSIENDPIRVHSAELHAVLSEDDMGWVQLTNSTSMRRFPKVPPRSTTRWQKWRLIDAEWYPVPERVLEEYPESPSRRDRAEEDRLRARFEESWIARRDRDLDRLHEMKDPRNRPDVSESELGGEPDPFLYLDREILWVEAIDEDGKVRVVIKYKSSDPNLKKAPPKFVRVTERWTKVDGEWYLDVGKR